MTQVSGNGNGNGNGNKRAVLYARVSTDDQAEKGYSLPSQLDAMRKYAAQQGFEIVGEFKDDYSGATPIEFRPEGGKAYAMLKSGNADLIIAYTIDRYVRPPEDGDEWDMPILIRGLAKLGKEIHTVRRGKLNTNFADLLIALLDARKAGEERRDIRERVMRGKRRKVKEGRVIGIRAPYGYRLVRDEHGKVFTLEIDETTARIVRIIYRWYVHGDESGRRLSSRAITRRLSEMGVSTPGERQKGYTRKRGKAMWNHEMVRHILSNELYAGTWHYGIRTTKQTKREDWESVSANIPAIVDRETWERAQAQRAKNWALAKRNAKREYLLSGRIRCGLCNSAYYGTFLHGVLYYRDSWEKTHHQRLEGGCVNKSIRASAIEADIWDEIRGLFQDPDRLWADLKAAQQNELTAQDPTRAELEAVEDLLRDAERDADEIAETMLIARGRVGERVQKQMDDCNTRITELTARRENLIAQLGTRKLTDAAIETIMQFARDIRAGIEGATFEEKRRTLENLDVQVTVTPGKYHVKTIVGEKDGEISQIGRDGMRIVTNSP
jgi:site-specific DNA recombinase